jgi:hypothetical protein
MGRCVVVGGRMPVRVPQALKGQFLSKCQIPVKIYIAHKYAIMYNCTGVCKCLKSSVA